MVVRAAPHLAQLARGQGVHLTYPRHDFLAAAATGTALSVTIVLAQDVPLHGEHPRELLEYRL